MAVDEDTHRTAYYFTRSFPFGLGEMWKAVELRHLRSRFPRVVVIPYSYAGNRSPCEVPAGVEVRTPLFDDDPSFTRWPALRRVLRSRWRGYYLRELVRGRAYRDRRWRSSWLSASAALDALLELPALAALVGQFRRGDVLIFFWGRGSCDFLPTLGPSLGLRSIVRLHRYDLFREINDGYIPYRSQMMEVASHVLPTSTVGVDELHASYPDYAHKVRRMPLGASQAARATPSEDGVFRILSCALVTPVKRLGLLAEALASVDFDIEWTHIGDGPLLESLRTQTGTLPSNVVTRFLGWRDPASVLRLFGEQPVDLFVNVSASEGVPISVQEALSAGVPVLATDVGGTRDVVDHDVGKLVSPGISPRQLAHEIALFRELTTADRVRLRHAARRRWENSCDAEKLAADFAQFAATGSQGG